MVLEKGDSVIFEKEKDFMVWKYLGEDRSNSHDSMYLFEIPGNGRIVEIPIKNTKIDGRLVTCETGYITRPNYGNIQPGEAA